MYFIFETNPVALIKIAISGCNLWEDPLEKEITYRLNNKKVLCYLPYYSVIHICVAVSDTPRF